MVRVMIADGQGLVRAGLRALVDSASEFVVVGEASTGRQAVEMVQIVQPDVAIVDHHLPDMDGLAVTREIIARRAECDVRVLILTVAEDQASVLRALRAGASGFLVKDAEPDELLEALRVVARGDILLSPTATKGLIADFLAAPDHLSRTTPVELAGLTHRELEVVRLVAHGLPNDAIAQQLVLSPRTAKTHVNRAMNKLGVRERAQLVVIAYRTGLV
jgi:DNA-binding NarL/FixJ family response regulator